MVDDLTDAGFIVSQIEAYARLPTLHLTSLIHYVADYCSKRKSVSRETCRRILYGTPDPVVCRTVAMMEGVRRMTLMLDKLLLDGIVVSYVASEYAFVQRAGRAVNMALIEPEVLLCFDKLPFLDMAAMTKRQVLNTDTLSLGAPIDGDIE